MFKKISKTITYLSIIFIVIGSIFLANGLILAWTTPTESPPDGNVSAPLTGTLGTSGQWCTTDGSAVNCTADAPSFTNTDYCSDGSCDGDLAVSGDLTVSGRDIYLGSQRLYGDNSSALYWDGNHNTVTQMIFRDKQDTTYGRVYGSGNGANFGLLDGDGNWSYLAVKDNYTQFRINNSAKMTINSNGTVNIGGGLSVGGNLVTDSFAHLTSGIAVNNGSNTGNKRGVWLWHPDDSNHVIYSANPSGTSPSGGSPVSGYWDGGHRMRFRTYASGQGFLWENSSEQRMMDLDADSGSLWIKGSLRVENGDVFINDIPKTTRQSAPIVMRGQKLYAKQWPYCPFFYSWNGEEYKRDVSIIEALAGKFLETSQTKFLTQMNQEGTIKGKISMEEPETSYIDSIKIIIEDSLKEDENNKIITELEPIWASRDLDKLLADDENYLIGQFGDEVFVEFGQAPPLAEGRLREIKINAKGYYDSDYAELQKPEWEHLRKEKIPERTMTLDAQGNLNEFRPLVIRNLDEFGYPTPENILTVNGGALFKRGVKIQGGSDICSSVNRGELKFMAGEENSPDIMVVCLKNTDGSYSWHSVASGN